MAHSDKLFYRKIVEYKQVLKFSYTDIVEVITGKIYKPKLKCHFSRNFKDGLIEYEPSYDFIFNKLVEFNNLFIKTYGLEYKLSDAKSLLDYNSYNVDKSFDEIKNTKHLDSYLELALQHHPDICDIFTYMAEVEDYYYNESHVVNDTKEVYLNGTNLFGMKFKNTEYIYPNLMLIENYLNKKIFTK
jgi:hypothetical protein